MKYLNQIKPFINKHLPILTILLVLMITHLPTIINNEGLMIFYGDSYEQQLQFYFGGWERFRNLDFSQWDWSLGYGANYFSHVFYFATSPFFLISTLFKKAVIPYLFIFLNALKLSLIFSFTYLWLSKISKSTLSKTIVSLIITFSGWVIFYYHYNHFLDAFIFYPLILWGIELYLQEKRVLPYALFLALLAFVNYYFLYMFVFFIIFYTLFRYFVINVKFKFSHFMHSVGVFFGFSVLALGMSAIILFPSFAIVLNTPRIQGLGEQNWLQLISFVDLFRYFSTLFSPVIQRFDPSAFISTSYAPGFGWGGGTSLYTSIIFPIAILSIFINRNTKERNLLFIFYAVLVTLLLFTSTYRILQGSMDVRWYYMFTLLNAYSLVRFLDADMTENETYLQRFLPSILALISILVLYFISKLKSLSVNPTHSSLALSITIIAAMIYISFPFLKKSKAYKPILLLLIIVESSASFLLPLTIDWPIESDLLKSYIEPTLDKAAIEYIFDIDKGFYRILGDSGLYSSQNDPFARYYRGTSFYESIYNYEQELFINRFKSTWSMPVTFGRTNTNFITSVKYFMSQGDHLPPFGFEYLTEVNGTMIYRNRYFIELGYTLDQTLNAEVFYEQPFLHQDRLFLNYIITEESKNRNFEFLNEFFTISEWVYDDRYYLDLGKPIQNAILYVENFDLPVFSINRIEDGDLMKTEKFWQYNYFSVYFDERSKTNAVEVLKDNVYQSPSGFNIYLDEDLSYYDLWYEDLSKTMFTDVSINNDKIDAKINLENKQWVATSVPYDKGWTVRIDGKSIDYQKVNLGFIGFELEKGAHELEFSYVAPGFKMGMWISIFSTLTYLGIVLFSIKKKKASV